jgi:fatty acid-binding protein DegV
LLSVKPIIAVEAGKVETADKPRTRSKSRERCIELICARPIERIAILHTMAPDVDDFRDEVVRRSGVDPASVMVSIVGPSVGPHLGPGCVGAAVLYKRYGGAILKAHETQDQWLRDGCDGVAIR